MITGNLTNVHTSQSDVGPSQVVIEKWLNLARIELTVFTDNEAAIALYRKFGFEIEGTLRKYAFRDGEFVDAYAMARIK